MWELRLSSCRSTLWSISNYAGIQRVNLPFLDFHIVIWTFKSLFSIDFIDSIYLFLCKRVLAWLIKINTLRLLYLLLFLNLDFCCKFFTEVIWYKHPNVCLIKYTCQLQQNLLEISLRHEAVEDKYHLSPSAQYFSQQLLIDIGS